MTTFNFTPSVSSVFGFQPTLDGQVYNATVPWLLFGARYYLNLTSLNGTPILYTALAGSPSGVAIDSLSWANGIVSAVTAIPHGYRIASTAALTISGCTPAAFNGKVDALITGPSSLSWPLPTDPGSASLVGNVSYDINLIGGISDANGNFFTSTLVFREQSQQFEVNP